MSTNQLTTAGISLLNQRLHFAPSISPNPFTIYKNLNSFIRNLTLKHYFNIQSLKNSPNLVDLPSQVLDSQTHINPIGLKLLEGLYMSGDEDRVLFTQHPSSSPPIPNNPFKIKSVFNPVHKKGPYLQTFYKVVYSEIVQMCEKTRPNQFKHSDLTSDEQQALKDLTLNNNLIIKTADKGVA